MPSLLERQVLLQALLAALEQASRWHGATVLLSGDAGIGQERAAAGAGRRPARRCRLHMGGCEALFTPRPLGPLQDVAGALGEPVASLLAEGAGPTRLFPAPLDEPDLPGAG
jgi:hypothetical protein